MQRVFSVAICMPCVLKSCKHLVWLSGAVWRCGAVGCRGAAGFRRVLQVSRPVRVRTAGVFVGRLLQQFVAA